MEEEEEKRKNKIISDFYESGIMQVKIDKICFKNFISRETQIHSDVLGEVFLQLSKMKTEKFLDWYDKKKSNIEGLGVTIAKRCFFSHPNCPDWPNHSIVKKILFASSYRQLQQVNTTDVCDDNQKSDYSYITLYDGEITENLEETKLEEISKELSTEENELLKAWTENDGKERNICFQLKIKPTIYRIKRDELFEKIRLNNK